jgi:hypothetical protein
MTGKCTRLLLAAGLGVALLQSTTYSALATSDWSSNPIAPAHSPTLFEVSGDVQKPGKYTLRDLKQLPETNANVVFISGGGSTSAKWVGVLLWDFLQHVGIKVDPNPPVKNGILRNRRLCGQGRSRLTRPELRRPSGNSRICAARSCRRQDKASPGRFGETNDAARLSGGQGRRQGYFLDKVDQDLLKKRGGKLHERLVVEAGPRPDGRPAKNRHACRYSPSSFVLRSERVLGGRPQTTKSAAEPEVKLFEHREKETPCRSKPI